MRNYKRLLGGSLLTVCARKRSSFFTSRNTSRLSSSKWKRELLTTATRSLAMAFAAAFAHSRKVKSAAVVSSSSSTSSARCCTSFAGVWFSHSPRVSYPSRLALRTSSARLLGFIRTQNCLLPEGGRPTFPLRVDGRFIEPHLRKLAAARIFFSEGKSALATIRTKMATAVVTESFLRGAALLSHGHLWFWAASRGADQMARGVRAGRGEVAAVRPQSIFPQGITQPSNKVPNFDFSESDCVGGFILEHFQHDAQTKRFSER